MRKYLTKKNLLILALALIALTSLTVTIIVLTRNNEEVMEEIIDPLAIPAFAPGAADLNARQDDESDEKLEAPIGGGAVTLTYAGQVNIDLSKAEASFTFKNPARSTQDLILQLVILHGDEQIVVAQSGLVPAGYSLSVMPVQRVSLLGEGLYKGQYNVLFYDPETKERAAVNAVIPVDIVTWKELPAD